ncbi:hypothetical protein AALO_G00120250 [Alosa alosa]|uniref:SGNH hydrolase-type esterase domain-containing protein n=1 Tax=Alosa alosa TaxID=278164 RepID=A0AAV6GJS5_9TELE|nr:hypothetical protein AALO_G00120250 [Alosa alosa]
MPSTSQLTSNPPKRNAAAPTKTPQPAKSNNLLPTTQTTKTSPQKTVMLMDSNGKHLHQKRMFPTHRTAKLWCPTTATALQHIEQFDMEAPDNLLIHTCTNDLHSKGMGVLELLKRVVESARKAFPEANIILSTLPPRTDFPWTTIQHINQEIADYCSSLNIKVAHYPNLTYRHLSDHVHLNQEGVRYFVKVLKDTTLCRAPTSAHEQRFPEQPHHTLRDRRTLQPGRIPARQTHGPTRNPRRGKNSPAAAPPRPPLRAQERSATQEETQRPPMHHQPTYAVTQSPKVLSSSNHQTLARCDNSCNFCVL